MGNPQGPFGVNPKVQAAMYRYTNIKERLQKDEENLDNEVKKTISALNNVKMHAAAKMLRDEFSKYKSRRNKRNRGNGRTSKTFES